jgi:hypothetical protein
MHFALLLSDLPHVNDARGEYGHILGSTAEPRRLRSMLSAVWAAAMKLVARL